MRRLIAIALVLLASLPVGSVLSAGTALAGATGPALVPGALDGSAPVKAGDLDASDRWIVVLRAGRGLAAAAARADGLGVHRDRAFNGAVRGYAARLSTAQLALLRADPNVETVVPDDIVSLAGQTIPTGVHRAGGLLSPIARIDGQDGRVNADVAIVDTGIDPRHPDLNVAGGVSCSTTSPTAWFDPNGHGTHVAGIVGALDNGIGVVGAAPGVRLWSVRILDTAGNGLLSWYVCGLDWIAAQRDPTDSTRPLLEAVNMSVAKAGRDDSNCGYTNSDVLHRAICRVVEAGITVVAAAGNNSTSAAGLVPAAYNEVITVSALADTDGRPGGLGGHACYSWNSYDADDTFANFSNYGSDVDLIAPGKCILSTLPGGGYGTKSGTSMAAPLVAGAVALYKSTRPTDTPAQVRSALRAMGNLNWKTATDPDPYHEPLLDLSAIVDLGDFLVRASATQLRANASGATRSVPVTILGAPDVALPLAVTATATEPVTASPSVETLEPGSDGALSLGITVPAGTPSGAYTVTVTADDGARQRSAAIRVVVDSDSPTATAPVLSARTARIFGNTSFLAIGRWAAATDATSAITGYQAQWNVDGVWGATILLPAMARSVERALAVGHAYLLRLRARDGYGNWGSWASHSALGSAVVQDTSSLVVRTGSWHRAYSRYASGGSILYTTRIGAAYALTFRGRGVAIVAPRGIGRGKFGVYIDGVRVGTVDEYASSYLARRVLFARSGLAYGTHTLRVVALATAGRQRIDVDALLVLR